MMQDFYRPSEYPSYIDGRPFLAGILEGRYAEGNKIDGAIKYIMIVSVRNPSPSHGI